MKPVAHLSAVRGPVVAALVGCVFLSAILLGFALDGHSSDTQEAWLHVPVDRSVSVQRPVETIAPD